MFYILAVIFISLGFLLKHNDTFAAAVRGIFSDNGQMSFSRVSCFVALIAVVCWVSHIVWYTLKIPELFKPTMFVCALYSINRVPDILLAWRGQQQAQQRGDQPAAAGK